jgi:hypothetical protein
MFLFEILRKFNLNPGPSLSLSLLSPPLFCHVEGQRPLATWPTKPAPTSHAKGWRPNRPQLACDQIALPCPESIHARRARAMWLSIPDGRATTRRRRCALAVALSRLRFPGSLAPSSTSPSLCAYKRAAPSPCSHAP